MEVEEEQDYPPTANAGEDIIIHLPKNEVTLHGNGSSDDHGMYDYTVMITYDFVRDFRCFSISIFLKSKMYIFRYCQL